MILKSNYSIQIILTALLSTSVGPLAGAPSTWPYSIVWQERTKISSTLVNVYAQHGCRVTLPNFKRKISSFQTPSVIHIKVKRNRLMVNNTIIPHYELYLRPIEGIYFINNRICSGTLHIFYDKKKKLLTSTLINFPRAYFNNHTREYAWNNWLVSSHSEQSQPVEPIADWKKKADAIKKEVRAEVRKAYKVRVLLEEHVMKKPYLCTLSCPAGFKIIESGSGINNIIVVKQSTLKIEIKKNSLWINNKKVIANTLKIIPCKGTIEFNKKNYRGTFILHQEANKVLIINHIDLEQYIYAVLHSESWPGWPLEVNKVFAIVCRSYVLAMMLRAQKSKLAYHVKDTNAHQRYNLYGIKVIPVIQQAVDQTRGIFLAFNNEPALAMFDSCCGGIIPAHIADFDFKKVPYLARPYACTFCKTSKLYSWQTMYTYGEIEQLIKNTAHHVPRFSEIRVHKKDKAGLVQEVIVKNKGTIATLSGKKVYSLSKNIKSYCFTILKKGKNFIFTGRGFGHHLGLCQWGARQMIREGWDYRSILHFYYPGVSWMKLSDKIDFLK